MCRGDRQQEIFRDDKDRERFLDTLAEEDLPGLKKGDARKKVIAWYIRKNTSVRVEWITPRLKMGSTSKFSYNYRAVEAAKEGVLWELKTTTMIKADWYLSTHRISGSFVEPCDTPRNSLISGRREQKK